MLFSSPVFVFLFLPVVLLVHTLLPRAGKNLWLLAASLLFYAWGEGELVVVMLASILGNWLLAFGVPRSRWFVGLAVAFNLGLLAAFKYANFLWSELQSVAGLLGWALPDLDPVHLPIGISFFTFQAMSYVIDVHRKEGPLQKNPTHFAVYIALFPQLIAGPIVRYRDIATQLLERQVTRAGFAYGVRRFVVGLAKKMLIANIVAQRADELFALDPATLGVSAAWLGAVCYTLQIYFDFSGYSDMAIGLGHMLGFRFLENFRYPYVAQSITDFWRRWHISLSSWFRDYLYIPLGGNRGSKLRTYFNLVTVFFLCGLWHGASWNFVVWGLFHGAFLVVERVGWSRVIERLGALQHVYVLLTVMVGWVFFRAENLTHAVDYLSSMFGLAGSGAGQTAAAAELAAQLSPETARPYLDRLTVTAIVAGLIGSTPWLPNLRERLNACPGFAPTSLRWSGTLALGALMLLCMAMLAADTYNPFIYFRF